MKQLVCFEVRTAQSVIMQKLNHFKKVYTSRRCAKRLIELLPVKDRSKLIYCFHSLAHLYAIKQNGDVASKIG